MLSTELITDLAGLEAISGEWDRLHASISPRRQDGSSLWCLTWWRSFRRSKPWVKDSLHSYAIRDSAGALVGLAPMFISKYPGWTPLGVKELQFFGAYTAVFPRSLVTQWRGLICRAEDAKAVTSALAAFLRAESPAHLEHWRGLSPDIVESSIDPRFRSHAGMTIKDFYLKLPASWEDFKSQLPYGTRRSVTRCYNMLEREHHRHRLQVAMSPEDVDKALESFFILHRTRAEAEKGVAHDDLFKDETNRAFIRDFCRSMASKGDLRIFQLMIADEIVATRIGFLFGDELHLYFSGFDVAWSRFSVMTTLIAEVIQWAIKSRLAVLNLGTGEDPSKARWRPECLQYNGGTVFNLPPPFLNAVGPCADMLIRLRKRTAGGAQVHAPGNEMKSAR